MKKIILFISLLVTLGNIAVAQNVGIGTTAPDASALLELKGTTKGFLPPRMLAAEKALIPSPKEGLIIYQTDGIKGLYIYNGSAWEALAGVSSGTGWALNGNSGTGFSNFVGTRDNQPLRFRVNNIASGGLDPVTANAAFGMYALANNTLGFQNNAIGFNSLNKNTLGANNNAFGVGALYENTTGNDNVALGTSALVFNKTGNGNVAVGYYSLYNNISGYSNVAIGTHTQFSNVAGNNIVAIGDSALYNNTASHNVGIGSKALYTNSTGVSNTAVGDYALFSNLTGSQNTALGRTALFANTLGDQNSAFGHQSLKNNNSGNRNSAIGFQSLFFNVSGDDNTALGYSALAKNVAKNNTAVGSEAMGANTSGERGTAVGLKALLNNTTGNYNTALGALSLVNNQNGTANTAVGDFSLSLNVSGGFNAAIGTGALSGNFSGGYNVAVGNDAMNNNGSGSYNTAIGADADIWGTTYTNATAAIGAKAQVACSDCIVLGSTTGYNGATTDVKVGVGITTPQKTLHVSPNGGGGIAIGGNITNGGYTVLNMGISQETGGYAFLQSVKSSGSAYGNLVFNQSGGNVGIRTATPLALFHIKQNSEPYPTIDGGIRLEKSSNTSHWDFGVDGASDLNFSYNGVPKFYFDDVDGDMYTTSDSRMKNDIQSVATALPAVMKLQPKSYHYIDNNKADRLSYGFLAQDVEKVFPDFVSTKGKDGFKAVGYHKINIMVVKAVQEQQAIIESQEKRIRELEEKVDAIIKLISK